MFHELEHIAGQKDDKQLGTDSYEGAMDDLQKFQQKCQPKDIPVKDAPQ